MFTINNVGMNGIHNVDFQGIYSTKKLNDKQSDDKTMKASTKLMIGATALAAIVVGGFFLHKGIKASKMAKQLTNDLKFQRNRMQRLFNSTNTSEAELTAKLKEIDKLTPTEQKVAYEELEKIHANIQQLNRAYDAENSGKKVLLRRGMKAIPENVKQEMNKGNLIKAGELYEAHVQKLPITYKAEYHGASVEETIKNALGGQTKIKPHNYDLAKENEFTIYTNHGGGRGYSSDVVTKDGVMYWGEYPDRGLRAECFPNYKKVKNGDVYITHGVSPKSGKYEVNMYLPDTNTNNPRDKFTISLSSVGNEMSPAQKDMLSLVDHPEKVDIQLFDKIVHNYAYYDMDLFLSTIQSMAK